ncbi:MAG: hypothetical protein AABW41_02750 [Nanoarchaeota archaeon]
MKIKTTSYELPGLEGEYDSLRKAFSGEAVSISEVNSYYLPQDAKGERLLMPDGVMIEIAELSSRKVCLSVSNTRREPGYIIEIVKKFGWKRPTSVYERPLRPDQRLEQILQKQIRQLQSDSYM